MGRFYYSQGGKFKFTGKFGFALQSSDAPEKFGMAEEPMVQYYTDDLNAALSQINKIFDALDVPAELRKTDFDNDESICAYVENIMNRFKDYDSSGPVKEDERTYVDEKDFKKEFRVKTVHAEALCDLLLGLRIYNAVRVDGECSLEAER